MSWSFIKVRISVYTYKGKSHLRCRQNSVFIHSLPQPETFVIPIVTRESQTLLGSPLAASYEAELWVGWGKAKIVKYIKHSFIVYFIYVYFKMYLPSKSGAVAWTSLHPPFGSSVNYPSSFLISHLLLYHGMSSFHVSKCFLPYSSSKLHFFCARSSLLGDVLIHVMMWMVNGVVFLNTIPPILYLTGFIKESHQYLIY